MIRPFKLKDTWNATRLQEKGKWLDIEEALTNPTTPLGRAILCIFSRPFARTHTYVSDGNEKTGRNGICGLIQTRTRWNRHEQDVTFISPEPGENHGEIGCLWQEMIEHTVAAAGKRGCHRIYASLPAGGEEQTPFRRAGFSAYTGEEAYVLEKETVEARVDGLPLRRQTPDDSWNIQCLYATVTPRSVQNAEGSAHGEWGMEKQGWWGRPPRKAGYIWEAGGDIFGVLKINDGRAGYWLRMLLHPDFYDETPSFLAAALDMMPGYPGKPIYCGIRSYEHGLAPALSDMGFVHFASRVLMVKHTTTRVRFGLPQKISIGERTEGATPSVPIRFTPTPTKSANKD